MSIVNVGLNILKIQLLINLVCFIIFFQCNNIHGTRLAIRLSVGAYIQVVTSCYLVNHEIVTKG